MRDFDAVIFDLDGVICYTDEYHYQAWKAMADELGVYFDRTINNRLSPRPRKRNWPIRRTRSTKSCWLRCHRLT